MIREVRPDSAPPVRVFVVLADEPFSKEAQECGLFYRVTDAEFHASQLRPPGWVNARIEPREIPLRDVHSAHLPMLTPEQQTAWVNLHKEQSP